MHRGGINRRPTTGHLLLACSVCRHEQVGSTGLTGHLDQPVLCQLQATAILPSYKLRTLDARRTLQVLYYVKCTDSSELRQDVDKLCSRGTAPTQATLLHCRTRSGIDSLYERLPVNTAHRKVQILLVSFGAKAISSSLLTPSIVSLKRDHSLREVLRNESDLYTPLKSSTDLL